MKKKNQVLISNSSTNSSSKLAPILGSDWLAPMADIDIVASQNVAVVTVRPDDDQEEVQINWGDGQIERIDLRQPPVQAEAAGRNGRYEFQHVYFKSPLTGQYPARAYVIVAILNRSQEKSYGGAVLKIEAPEVNELQSAEAPLNDKSAGRLSKTSEPAQEKSVDRQMAWRLRTNSPEWVNLSLAMTP